MEKIDLYRVNTDYEYSLFDPLYENNKNKYSKYIDLLEFVFFYIQRLPSTLASSRTYSDSYLKLLKSYGLPNHQIIKINSNPTNWWGKLLNLNFEKKINSKIYSIELARKLELFEESIIVENINDLQKSIEFFEEKFVIKSPFKFSGQGFYWIDDRTKINLNNFKNELMLGPMILEKHFNRVLDFSCNYDFNLKKKHFSINLVTSTGSSVGSVYLDEQKFENFFTIFFGKSGKDLLRDYLNQIEMVLAQFYNVVGYDNIGIDSFIFNDKGLFKLKTLCEINLRKTLGLLGPNLIEIFNLNGQIGLVLFSYNSNQNNLINSFFIDKKVESFCLNPSGQNLSCQYVILKDLLELYSLILHFYSR